MTIDNSRQPFSARRRSADTFVRSIYFNGLEVTTRVLATIAFLLLTAPVAAHMIARAAYHQRIPLWSGTVRDELAASDEKARSTTAG